MFGINTHNHNPENTPPAESRQGFFGLGIAPKILEILDKIKFQNPTPIQSSAIPMALEGKDVIGIAQTGTGKTHAFIVPMVQNLTRMGGDFTGLVLAPTRELALQIDEAAKHIALPFGIRTACLIGGASMNVQMDHLRRHPRILIATPGRLIDHLERRTVRLDKVRMMVLDEADRMLDMGFAPQVEKILASVPRERQTMLFSATMPEEILQMVENNMKLPVHVEMAPAGTTVDRVTQELYIVSQDMKTGLLKKVLQQYPGSVLLFTRTKFRARKIAKSVRDMGYSAAEIHSDRSLNQRKEALQGFKTGYYRVLVATDIAARGIDVSRIELVVNFDLPDEGENYVHRIGRTARAGRAGRAISFATPDQKNDVANIERLIRMQLPLIRHPEMPTEEFVAYPEESRGPKGAPRSWHSGGRRGRGGFGRRRR